MLAASGVLHAKDVPTSVPAREAIIRDAPDGILHSGGSRIVGPDGVEMASLDSAEEGLVAADLERALLLGERQNFDAAGHYHRSDVFGFEVDRRRQAPASYKDE